MEKFQAFDGALLHSSGLNRHAVFDIHRLPGEIAGSLGTRVSPHGPYRQLILIGHAGRALWDSLLLSGVDSENPIDDFTVGIVRQWFAQYQPQNIYDIVYPGIGLIGLQGLGQLAGWHHASPFGVGIDPEWGTWYAYRAVILADTAFEPTRPVKRESPCEGCSHRICVVSCPGGAMAGEGFDLGKCVSYRKQPGSRCKASCLARISCPVGSSHRYCDEQIRHTYSISMAFIERFY